MKGLIHVYTGDGKGKTTAALGQAIRAHGCGMSVLMVQFLKRAHSGELETVKKLGGGFELMRGKSAEKFVTQMNESEKAECRKETGELFCRSINSQAEKGVDILILDEVFAAINSKMLDVGQVIEFLHAKPEKLEVILTGRGAPEEIVELADYVTEIRSIKHPIDKGIPARKGIEF
jgi:cob(I)alamin adenosyltransferase